MEDRFEELAEMLDDIVDALPAEYFRGLNGGVLFSEETMRDEDYPELYILGHYKQEPIGRSIVLYYGSFLAMYGSLPKAALYEELKKTLYHELTHHLETLAGEDDLVREDRAFMDEYRRDNG